MLAYGISIDGTDEHCEVGGIYSHVVIEEICGGNENCV